VSRTLQIDNIVYCERPLVVFKAHDFAVRYLLLQKLSADICEPCVKVGEKKGANNSKMFLPMYRAPLSIADKMCAARSISSFQICWRRNGIGVRD
jgi:hypothetical protein